jgi:hypothetical protein
MDHAAVAAAPEMAPLARLPTMATQLARPVACGWLTLTEAHAALLVAASHTDLGDLRFTDFVRSTQDSLHLTLENEHVRRYPAAHPIRRTLAPMIAQQKPKRALRRVASTARPLSPSVRGRLRGRCGRSVVGHEAGAQWLI